MERLIRKARFVHLLTSNFFAVLILGFFAPISFAGQIEVTVLDIFNNAPISKANVTIRERVIVIGETGELHLRPLSEAVFIEDTETGPDGKASVEVSSTEMFAVEFSADGYEGQVEPMLRLPEAGTTRMTIMLIPSEHTEDQAELLRSRQEVIREPVEQGPAEFREGELRAFAVTVPDEVRVQDLNGFTGMMNFDEFLGGVVTAEMNDGFPREALRAQAVASRSYALHRLRSPLGRANGGQAYRTPIGTLSRAAAIFTSKQVLLYNGAVAQAFFSARCNGDFTLDSEDGPTLTSCRPGGLGGGVVPFCRTRPCSGHINCSQTSEQCCVVTINSKTNYIYGHGVGMCQRGAQQFASRDGWTYQRMLTNFYTSVTLHKGTNALQLTMLADENAGASPEFLIEVRSGQPDTLFDIQRTPTLSNPVWSSLAAERGLNTGTTALRQIRPQGEVTAATYFRAILRE